MEPLELYKKAQRSKLIADALNSRRTSDFGSVQDPHKVKQAQVLGNLPLDVPEYTPDNMPDFTEQVMNMTPAAGIFAGVNAKTANKLMLKRAREMSDRGVDRKNIWKKTGWFRDVDDKWKYEIDDSAMKYDERNLQKKSFDGRSWREGSLGEGMDHPELHKAYRSAKDINTVDYPFQHKGGIAGQYREPVKNSTFRWPDPENITMWGYKGKKEILAHELQHGIQRREGFARGGNVSMFSGPSETTMARIRFLNEEMSRAAKKLDKYTAHGGGAKKGFEKEYARYRKTYDDAMSEKLRRWDENPLPINKNWTRWNDKKHIVDEMRKLKESPKYEEELAASNKLFKSEYSPRIDAAQKLIKERSDYAKIRPKIEKVFADYKKVQAEKFPTLDRFEYLNREHRVGLIEPKKHISPDEAYLKLAGEAEARNVQTRLGWTLKQRKKTPPWESLDVPEDELIVKMGERLIK